VIETAVTLFGSRLSLPVFVSPTAFHCLAHPEGERATARAAAEAGTVMTVSMASTVGIEEIATCVDSLSQPGPGLWFQCYFQPDLGFTKAVIQRAEAAGARTLVVTVDSPTFGRRERDLRLGFTDLPPGLCCENMREPQSGGGYGLARKFSFTPQYSWSHVEWLRKVTQLPILLKGILNPDDARLALDHGVQGIFVSNHGGRQLDGVPATIEALPAVADAVAGRIPVLMDGGIRRGTDVIKALALGATAVGIGRPVLWGLAVGGQPGVREVLEILRLELQQALTLCGLASVSQLNRKIFHPPSAVGFL
jgi:4-hydroxymandelate oxidase